ncbi:MAG: hypothetical protein Sapg2KO_25130 [Saprospiraceae bacterium]
MLNLCLFKLDFPKSNDELWDFKITVDDIGMLTLNSFALYGFGQLDLDYKLFFAEVFKRLKNEIIPKSS